MASPPAWSIGASKRSGKLNSSGNIPGPGSYNSRSVNKLQYPSWSMGTSIRNGDKFENVPGPGTYNSPGKFNSTAPSYSLGIKTDNAMEGFGPGPGSYNMNRHKGNQSVAPSFSFRMKTQLPEEKGNVPGPGTYSQASKVTHQASPNYRIGSAQRSGLYNSADVPGPGTYAIKSKAFGKDTGPKYGFGSSDRNGADFSSGNSPGPGAYSSKTQFGGSGRGFSLVPKRDDGDIALTRATPGPGTYSSSLKNKHSQPSYRIGSALRGSLSGGNPETPGPGNYNMRNSFNGPNTKIGTSLRSTLEGGRNVPGPGTYNYRTKIGEGPKYFMNPKREDVYKGQNDRSVPGPGAYNPSLSATKFHSSSAMMGSGERADFGGSRLNPGPGQYDIRGGLKGPKWGFGSQRRDNDINSFTPGPGYYKLPPKIGDVAPYAYKSFPLKIHI